MENSVSWREPLELLLPNIVLLNVPRMLPVHSYEYGTNNKYQLERIQTVFTF